MINKARLGALISTMMVSGLSFAAYTYTPVAIVGQASGKAAVIAVGISDGSDFIPYKTRVYKYNNAGSVLSTQDYNYVKANSATVDSADKVIIAGSYNNTDYFVAKTGTGLGTWSHNWAGNGGVPVMPKVACDSFDQVYAVGHSYNGTKYDSVGVRFLSTGTNNLSVTDGTSYSAKWTDMAIDTTRKLVVAGVEKDSSGIAHAVGYKFDGSGSVTSSVNTGSVVYDARVSIDDNNRYYFAYSMTYIDRTPGVDEEDLVVRKCSVGGFGATWTNYVVTSTNPRIFLAWDDYGNALAGSDNLSSGQTTMHFFDSSTGSPTSDSPGSYDAVGLYVDPGNGRWFAATRWDLLAINSSGYFTPSVYDTTRVAKCSSYIRTGTDVIDGLYVASTVTGYKFLVETPAWTIYQS